MEKTLKFYSKVDCAVDGNELSFLSNEIEIKVVEEYVISQESIKISAECFEDKGEFDCKSIPPCTVKLCDKGCKAFNFSNCLTNILLLLIIRCLK